MSYDIVIEHGYYGTKIFVAVYLSTNRSIFRDTKLNITFSKLMIKSEFKIKPRLSDVIPISLVPILQYFILQTFC